MWLERLHDCYDEGEDFYCSLQLQGSAPNGPQRVYQPPLSQYHKHQGKGEVFGLSVQIGESLLPLDPILTVQRCLVCHEWTAFYLTKAEKKKTWFLDFIGGHTHTRKDIPRLEVWRNLATSLSVDVQPEEPDDPQFNLFRNFDAEFVPPHALYESISHHFCDLTSGAVHIVGGSGMGKSWAMNGLTRQLPGLLKRAICCLHLPLHRETPPTARGLLLRLSQLLRANDLTPPDELPEPHWKTWVDWLGQLRVKNSRREFVVIFDGLDELPEDSDVPQLFPPSDLLKAGIYLIYSSRPEVRLAARSGLARIQGGNGSNPIYMHAAAA